MKNIEIAIYILFALAIFFAFGLIYVSLVFLLVAFLLVGRMKKYDKKKAKKLNYIGIAILILNIILFVLSGILSFLFISSIFSRI